MMIHTNDRTFEPGPGKIFVFGSNDAGIHGAGAAKLALDEYGAQWGRGEGFSGTSYAIPTKTIKPKTTALVTKSLHEIGRSIDVFLAFARMHPELEFFVTRIGCGLAGYNDKDIAPFFIGATTNVILPIGWDNPETL